MAGVVGSRAKRPLLGGGGGGRGMLTRKILKISASNGCIWCIFEVNSAPTR